MYTQKMSAFCFTLNSKQSSTTLRANKSHTLEPQRVQIVCNNEQFLMNTIE